MTKGYQTPRQGAAAHRQAIASRVADAITQPKSELIAQWKRLEEARAPGAESLGRIIARLEAWQARYA
jgi:hypothetical protein